MTMHDLKKGDRVYWTDPDPHGNSGRGTVVSADHPEVICLKMDDGGEVEAMPHELRLVGTVI
jgi:uncharacterized protein YndB with AHSA1/START domain